MKILAIDPGTKAGWAHSDGPSGIWDLSIRRDESGGMRLVRFKAKLKELQKSLGMDLVVYEAARHAGPKMQGALVVAAEMQGILKDFFEEKDIDYQGRSSKEIKKHATGNGNANKEKMVAAAEKNWPETKIIDHNHADALWLLSLIESELGQ